MKEISEPIKLAMVEDQSKYRDYIRELLDGYSKEFSLEIYSGAEEFLATYTPGKYDLILVDLVLRDMGGAELIRILGEKYEEFKCIVVSSLLSESQILNALKAGAIGYLHKFEIEDLVGSLRIFREGGSVISPSIAAKILPTFRKEKPQGWEDLSTRERQILEELKNGQTSEEIAKLFQLSIHTVRTQIRSIYKKIQVNNRIQLLKKLDKNP